MKIRLADKPQFFCGKTVKLGDFKEKTMGKSNVEVPVSENWLYMTKSRPVEKDPLRAGRDCSANVPDWFKVKESKLVKDHDITKSQGFDGTVTVLSRITGWITVSPRSKNRQNRIGRYGPFDKSKKGVNFQNVSDLAPAWMQNKADRCENTIFKKTLAPNFIREEKSKKRMFLVDKVQPEKSVFSIGDFRHNVSTRDEADHFTKGLSESTKRIFEWKEEISKQPYDKPITGKVGQ